jgi:hypothetical protein
MQVSVHEQIASSSVRSEQTHLLDLLDLSKKTKGLHVTGSSSIVPKEFRCGEVYVCYRLLPCFICGTMRPWPLWSLEMTPALYHYHGQRDLCTDSVCIALSTLQ